VSLEAADRADIRAFWNDQSGLALTAEGLKAPERGRAFQLWAIPTEGAPVSIDVFRPDEDDRALIFAQPTIASAQSQALAITEEDADGAEQPTSNPIWVGPLR
jgi:anti-sigma-K factor RskA